MRALPALLFVVLISGGCGVFNNFDYYKARDQSGIISKSYHSQVAMQDNRPVIIIPVEIKGTIHDFIFDTGAAITVISKDLATELNLEEVADVITHDSKGNSQELNVVMLDTVGIGGVQFSGIASAVVEWSDNSVIGCLSPAGIIGNNLIRHSNWVVDYKNKQLLLSDSSMHREGMRYVEMQSPQGRPFIEIKADSLELQYCLLDLGSGGSLDVSRAIAEDKEWNWKKYPHINHIDGSSEGLFGSKLDTTIQVKIDSVAIGDYVVYNPVVDIERKNGAKVGTKILEQAVLYLDYSNEKAGFLPYDSLPQYGHLEGLGFSPLMDTTGFYVASITEGSPLWQAGVRYGDRITRLYDKVPADFNGLCEYLNWLLEPGKPDTSAVIMKDTPETEIEISRKNLWLNE